MTRYPQIINTELLEDAPWIAEKKYHSMMDQTKITQRRFDISNILKILYALKESNCSFSELYTRSKIRMKSRFLCYLNLTLKLDLVNKKTITRTNTVYKLNMRGLLLLNLFLQK